MLGFSGHPFYCEQDISAGSAGVGLQVGPVLR